MHELVHEYFQLSPDRGLKCKIIFTSHVGCHRLGYFHGYVDKDKPDAIDNAKRVFKMNCEENKFGQSCDSLAAIYLNEKKCK